MQNKNNPSNNASYNWLGCLGKPSLCGKITAQGTLVCRPQSSAFMKFAILPKKRPIGATIAKTSENERNLIRLYSIKYNGCENVLETFIITI